MSHTCLTRAKVLDLMGLEPTSTSKMGPSIWALQALSSCERCWEPIDALRNEVEEVPITTRSPFAALFQRLVHPQASRVSHLRALTRVQVAPLGLYRLLLEEIAEQLPNSSPRNGQLLFLMYGILLDEIPSQGKHWHDLQALAASYAAVFFERQGWDVHADGKQRQAARHLQRGTGAKDLRATQLACLAERLHHRGHHIDAFAHMQCAIHLTSEDPARRVELLMFCAIMRTESQNPWQKIPRQVWRAWEQLLEAEYLADLHELHLQEPILRQLVVIEQVLADLGLNTHGILILCLLNHHQRRLGVDADLCCHPPETWQREVAPFTSLCLAWSAGQPVTAEAREKVAALLASSPQGTATARAFQAQLHDLWEKYPEGTLAADFLVPLIETLGQLCPAA
jgi:hypothetical protein